MNIRGETLLSLVQSGMRGDRSAFVAQAKIAAGKAPPDIADRIERTLQSAPSVTMLVPSELTKIVREIQPWTSKDELVWSGRERGLHDSIVAEYAARDLLAERGLPIRSRVLLHGESGTGKSAFVSALSASLGLPLLEIPMDSLVESFLGASSANIRKVLEWTIARPSVVWLDEIDAIATARGKHSDHAEQSRMVTTLIVVLDQLRRTGLERAIVVATTNRADALDRAIWRRFDIKQELELPTLEKAEEIWHRVFRRAGLEAPMPCRLRNPAEIESLAIEVARDRILEQSQQAKVEGGNDPR